MYRYWDVVTEKILERITPEVMVEIGADYGNHTRLLLDFCRSRNCTLHVVDPFPKFDVKELERQYGNLFVFHEGLSLNMLPLVSGCDVAFIDGDHNWYTVYNEFMLLDKSRRKNGRDFPVVFLHDIGWPYGRRDLYYNPDTIPEHFRKPYKNWGLRPGFPELEPEGGLNRHLYNSIYENDLQNGVLTAAEDFLNQADFEAKFFRLPGLSGLGIIVASGFCEKNPALSNFLDNLQLAPEIEKYLDRIEGERLNILFSYHERDEACKKFQDRNAKIKNRYEDSIQRLKDNHAEEIEKLKREQNERIEDINAKHREQTGDINTKYREQIESANTKHRDQLESVNSNYKEQIEALKIRQEERVLKIGTSYENRIDKIRRQLEDQIGKLRVLSEKRKKEIEQLHKNLEAFKRLAVNMRVGFSQIIFSNRWKIGCFVADLVRKVSFGKKTPLIPDEMIKHIDNQLSEKERRDKKQDSKTPPEQNMVVDNVYRFEGTVENRLVDDLSVTIVIAVYNAFEKVEECLNSVIEFTDPRHGILVIDDASTDIRVWPMLQSFADKRENVEILKNEKNIGYTRTVNIGCGRCSSDVILLNSDTVVSPSWVERLIDSAYKSADFGIVTPVSNNAGVFSVPLPNMENALPEGYSIRRFAELVSDCGLRVLPELPTGNGFCMFVKRSVFDAAGFFDEVNFPRGYGEENDFCIRAAKAGFKNVLDDGIYIFHYRTASFGNEKNAIAKESTERLRALYPEYSGLVAEFQRNHPLRYMADAIDAAVSFDLDLSSKAAEIANVDDKPSDSKRRVLYILHDGGGGLVFTSIDLARTIKDRYTGYILFCGTNRWRLHDPNSQKDIYSFYFENSWHPKNGSDPNRFSIIKLICRKMGISIVHIRSLIGLPPNTVAFLRWIGTKVVLSVHDLFTVCPTIQLIDEKGSFCDGICTSGKGVCKIQNRWYHPIADLKHEYIFEWRRKMKRDIVRANVLITTSPGIRSLVSKRLGISEKVPFEIIEHGRDIEACGKKAVFTEGMKKRIVAIGVAGCYKGAALMKTLLDLNVEHRKRNPDKPYFEFHFMGSTDVSLKEYGSHAHYHGLFEREHLPVLLGKINPSFAIIPSAIPETYSHTLTEFWRCGIPVFGTNLGAVRERIEAHGGGWVLNYNDPVSWYNEMVEFASNQDDYKKKLGEIETIPFRSTKQMSDDYARVYDSLCSQFPGDARPE